MGMDVWSEDGIIANTKQMVGILNKNDLDAVLKVMKDVYVGDLDCIELNLLGNHIHVLLRTALLSTQIQNLLSKSTNLGIGRGLLIDWDAGRVLLLVSVREDSLVEQDAAAGSPEQAGDPAQLSHRERMLRTWETRTTSMKMAPSSAHNSRPRLKLRSVPAARLDLT